MEKIQSEGDSPVLGAKAIAAGGLASLILLGGLIQVLPPTAAVLGAYLFFSMVLITLADLRHYIIPDVLSLPAIPAGLLASALLPHEGGWTAGLIDGAIGALTGSGVFFLLRTLYFRLRGVEGLGLGDVKLAAVAGAWLGAAALAPACLVATLAALLGVVVSTVLRGRHAFSARAHIPFGSYIAPTIFAFWAGRVLASAGIW